MILMAAGPVHASWLNQIEIYFSIVQRKALTPNDFPCLSAVWHAAASNVDRAPLGGPFVFRATAIIS